MRYIFTTQQLLTLLRASDREPNGASPFRTLMTLNGETEPTLLNEEQRLLAAFALTPENTYLVGRHSSADGVLYVLKIGALYYLYTWFEAQDRHIFEAYFDRPRLLKFLSRNFCGFYRPNFGAYTQLDLFLTDEEYMVWNLIRALYAARTVKGAGDNRPFLADDLKSSDLILYLRNYLEELGMTAYADRIDALTDEKNHIKMEQALIGLEQKGVLSADVAGITKEDTAYGLSRTAMERLDDGMLVDTVYFSDRTDPRAPKEFLFSLRRDGVCALIPKPGGVALRTFSDFPWEDLI